MNLTRDARAATLSSIAVIVLGAASPIQAVPIPLTRPNLERALMPRGGSDSLGEVANVLYNSDMHHAIETAEHDATEAVPLSELSHELWTASAPESAVTPHAQPVPPTSLVERPHFHISSVSEALPAPSKTTKTALEIHYNTRPPLDDGADEKKSRIRQQKREAAQRAKIRAQLEASTEANDPALVILRAAVKVRKHGRKPSKTDSHSIASRERMRLLRQSRKEKETANAQGITSTPLERKPRGRKPLDDGADEKRLHVRKQKRESMQRARTRARLEDGIEVADSDLADLHAAVKIRKQRKQPVKMDGATVSHREDRAGTAESASTLAPLHVSRVHPLVQQSPHEEVLQHVSASSLSAQPEPSFSAVQEELPIWQIVELLEEKAAAGSAPVQSTFWHQD